MSAIPGDEPTSTSLLNMVELVRGVSYKKAEARNQPGPGLVPVIRANNIQDGQLVFEGLVYVPRERVSDVQRVRKGDIVIAMSSGSPDIVGKAALARLDWEGGFGAFCGALRAKPGTSSELLSHFMKSPAYRAAVDRVATGTNINNLSRTTLASIEVPTFEAATQEHLAMMLSELEQHRRSSSGHLSVAVQAIARFRRVVLAAACSGRLTEDWRKKRPSLAPVVDPSPESLFDLPDGWHWTTLDGLRAPDRPIIYGIIKPGPHDPNGVPYVRVVEMKEGTIDVESLRRAAPARAAKFQRATLRAGDILISKDGTIGKVAVVPEDLEGGNITQHLVRFSPRSPDQTQYLVLALRSPVLQGWLNAEKKGVALQGVNVEDFRRLPVPIPPLEEQHEIMWRADQLLTLADELQRRVGTAEHAIMRSSQAVLAKAFRGELVPTEAQLAKASLEHRL